MASETRNVSRDGTRAGSTASEAVHAAETRAKVFERKSVLHLNSNDADELAASIPGWDMELTQLRPGRFTGHAILIPLGSVLVGCGKFDQPVLLRFAGPQGCLTINRPGRGSAPAKHLGRTIDDDECFVGAPASETEGVGGTVIFPTALSMRLDAWQGPEPWLSESRFLSLRGTHLYRAGTSWNKAFLDGMEWIVAAVEQYPDSFARSDVRESLADQLLARVDTLGARDFPLSQDRRARVQRRGAVQRARAYISRNLTDPIRLSDLCRYAGSEARALEYGFQDVMGMSPMAYVRNTRLHRVRRALRSSVVSRRSISEIALDCGFWHLSQFAVDYKRLFGESPSITFRRTQAALPAIDRRRQTQAVAYP